MLAFVSPSETGTGDSGVPCLRISLQLFVSDFRLTRVHQKLIFLLVGLQSELVLVVLVGQLRSFAWPFCNSLQLRLEHTPSGAGKLSKGNRC